jgi:hypothetical protein
MLFAVVQLRLLTICREGRIQPCSLAMSTRMALFQTFGRNIVARKRMVSAQEPIVLIRRKDIILFSVTHISTVGHLPWYAPLSLWSHMLYCSLIDERRQKCNTSSASKSPPFRPSSKINFASPAASSSCNYSPECIRCTSNQLWWCFRFFDHIDSPSIWSIYTSHSYFYFPIHNITLMLDTADTSPWLRYEN